MLSVLLALLVQAVSDDPPAASAAVDIAIKSITGYRTVETLPVGDDAFLRRITRDMIDAEPAAAEIKSFVDDRDPRKRTKKINQLLDDPRFGDFWAKRFTEVFFRDLKKFNFVGLGNPAPGLEESILPAFTKWLAARISKDTPWSEIVTELLESRRSLEDKPALAYKFSFHREVGMEEAFADGITRHLLGIRLTCARCHEHPYDVWDQKHFFGVAAFASGRRLDRTDGLPYFTEGAAKGVRAAGGRYTPQFLGDVKPAADEDPMKALARSITVQYKSQLGAVLANRVWSWLFGWGVVHLADDFNRMVAPISGDVLTLLRREGGFSIKRLIRAVCNSQSYQLPTPAEAPGGESFRHLAARKFALGGFVEKTTKWTPKLEFTAPESWKRVKSMMGSSGEAGFFRLPDPSDPSRHAELRYYEGAKLSDSAWVNRAQFQNPVIREEPFEGNLRGTLKQTSGSYACRPGSTAPLDYTILVAITVSAGGTSFAFKLEGPSDLVTSWREEFDTLLKSARLR